MLVARVPLADALEVEPVVAGQVGSAAHFQADGADILLPVVEVLLRNLLLLHLEGLDAGGHPPPVLDHTDDDGHQDEEGYRGGDHCDDDPGDRVCRRRRVVYCVVDYLVFVAGLWQAGCSCLAPHEAAPTVAA